MTLNRKSDHDNDDDGDYINANFVDGYQQKRAFISSQVKILVWHYEAIVTFSECYCKNHFMVLNKV